MTKQVDDTETSFTLQWVTQGPNDRVTSRDTRTKIRKQAMKAVLHARRQRPNVGQSRAENAPAVHRAAPDPGSVSTPIDGSRAIPATKGCAERQPAETIRNMSSLVTKNDTAATANDNRVDTRIPLRMPFTGIDLLMSESGINLNDLYPLTCIYQGEIGSSLLSFGPAWFGGLLSSARQPYWEESFFSFIGARYGCSACLDDAIRCLVTKIKSLAVPSQVISRERALLQYGRALKSIQATLETPEACLGPDVLCAIAVLAIFELLEYPSTSRWTQHIKGAGRLIQIRGPDRFKTDFERKILVAIYPALCYEALRTMQPCFFEEQQWSNYITSSIDRSHPFSQNGPFMLRGAEGTMRLPRLWGLVNGALQHEYDVTDSRVIYLVDELWAVLFQARQWRDDFNSCVVDTLVKGEQVDNGIVQAVLAVGISWRHMTSRFLAALDPLRRGELEGEAQAQARELKRLEMCRPPQHSKAALYLLQKVGLAEATITTAPVWAEAIGSDTLLEYWRFGLWCKLIEDPNYPGPEPGQQGSF